jgi:hypothetical protein
VCSRKIMIAWLVFNTRIVLFKIMNNGGKNHNVSFVCFVSPDNIGKKSQKITFGDFVRLAVVQFKKKENCENH